MTTERFILILILLISLECPAVQLSLPDTTVAAGDTFLIPIRTEDVTGLGVFAYELTVGFQEGVILATGATSANTITSTWGAPFVNTNHNDQIQVVSAGITPLEGEGNLVFLELFAIGTPGSVTPLEFLHAMFNEGNPLIEYNVPACSIWVTSSAVSGQNHQRVSNTDLQIYPNPTNARINLRYQTFPLDISQIELYDITGRVVLKMKSPVSTTLSGIISIDLSHIPSGYYLLSLSTSVKQTSKPIIIIR